MDTQGLKLKLDCMLRRAGLSHVPRPALAAVVGICLIALVFALVRFWPTSSASEDFSLTSEEQVASSALSQSDQGQGSAQSSELVVDVEGEVVKPGIVRLAQGSRWGDAIEAAGGFTKKADRTSVNLAQLASDGAQLTVARKGRSSASTSPQAGTSTAEQAASGSSGSGTGKININTATVEELQALQGVGPSIAQRIADYRDANGPFTAIEDLKDVSGIGDARFDAVKDAICV